VGSWLVATGPAQAGNLANCAAFMGFGLATKEFEVTEERLGTYQAHEHIDNPKGYRKYFGKN
jgi:hypothetical protein